MKVLLLASASAAAAATAVANELRFEPAEVDFGRRAQNQSCAAEVTVTNTGARAVKVLGIESDCGCTSGQILKSELAAGEATKLTVRLDTGGGEGELSHRVFLNTDTGRETVSVSARVYRYANWRVTPVRAVFAPSRQGEAVEMDVQVEYLGKGKPPVVKASATATWLEVEALPVTPDHPERLTYRLKKRADAPGGSLFGSLRIATRDPAAKTIDVPVFAYVSSGVTVTPSPVILMGVTVTEAQMTGWKSKSPPRAELAGAEVRVESGPNETWVLAIASKMGKGTRSVESLKIYDGQTVMAEVPVVFR